MVANGKNIISKAVYRRGFLWAKEEARESDSYKQLLSIGVPVSEQDLGLLYSRNRNSFIDELMSILSFPAAKHIRRIFYIALRHWLEGSKFRKMGSNCDCSCRDISFPGHSPLLYSLRCWKEVESRPRVGIADLIILCS